MADETKVAIEVAPENEIALVPQFHAVAVNATEMAAAKTSIQIFLRSKLNALRSEREEAQANLDAAKKHKWKFSSFASLVSRIQKKELYYGKLLSACEAGYTIVPNMEMQVFAIRVKRDKPIEKALATQEKWEAHASVEDEEEQRLPVGEGRYENPSAFVSNKRWNTTDEKGVITHHHLQRATSFDEMEFPLAVAHPLVMDATAAAMQRKIFDRIGIVSDSRMTTRGKDPIVLGQIRMREAYGYRTASFLIAWYLDPRTL